MKSVVWVVVVLVLVAIGWLLLGNNNQSNNDATQKQTTTDNPSTDVTREDKLVTYTNSGFSPSSLTIKQGATVTFRNDSDNPLWVASNPHPTHTGLSGFDAGKNFDKGETYTFTFTKTGTWGYHNHPNSADTGEVIVE